jgi:hypothetical protein
MEEYCGSSFLVASIEIWVKQRATGRSKAKQQFLFPRVELLDGSTASITC